MNPRVLTKKAKKCIFTHFCRLKKERAVREKVSIYEKEDFAARKSRKILARAKGTNFEKGGWHDFRGAAFIVGSPYCTDLYSTDCTACLQ